MAHAIDAIVRAFFAGVPAEIRNFELRFRVFEGPSLSVQGARAAATMRELMQGGSTFTIGLHRSGGMPNVIVRVFYPAEAADAIVAEHLQLCAEKCAERIVPHDDAPLVVAIGGADANKKSAFEYMVEE